LGFAPIQADAAHTHTTYACTRARVGRGSGFVNTSGIALVTAVVGGLGIFMLGMKYMSEGMQSVAGNSLRRMISLVTTNPLLATGVGTGVTVLVQSSTVTTVLVVGLVNAGLMQVPQAIGVIMGANIGTTITGWILVFQVGAYGLPLLGVAALVHVFARRDRLRFVAMAFMGMGMVFFGLELMKNGFAPLKDMPAFVDAFARFQADSYTGVLLAALVGCTLTLVVQSSSATLGITIGLATTGVIPFTTAAALVLGENIGTTITAVLASLGSSTNGKRAALAHVLFNLIGAAWVITLFPWYSRAVAAVIHSVHGADPMTMSIGNFADAGDYATVITAAIALTHTGFNVTNTLLFLPFVRPFGRLLERICPHPAVKEVAALRPLDARGVSAPVLALEQSRGEVLQMGQSALKMMDWIRVLAFNDTWDRKLAQKVFHREEVLDRMQREIVVFLTETLDATVSHAVAEEGRQQLRIAHEYESLGDRLSSILKGLDTLREQGLALAPGQKAGLLELHDRVAAFLHRVTEAYTRRDSLPEDDVRLSHAAIVRQLRALNDEHLQRMIDSAVPPSLSLIYAGVLTDYRRVGAHTLNVHEATATTRGAAA
jgi:phosphate:Na+ symporter